jgi:hypothetical protein
MDRSKHCIFPYDIDILAGIGQPLIEPDRLYVFSPTHERILDLRGA